MPPSLETRFQIAVLAGTPDRMAGLDQVASIEWLFCKQAGESLIEFYQEDRLLSSVDLQNPRFDLPYLVSVLYLGETDGFKTFQNQWNFALPSLTVALRQLSEWDDRAILCAAIDSLADDLTLHRQQSGRAALDLATFRGEFDRLQRSFARLEEYASRRSYEAATEIFCYEPDTEVSAMGVHCKQFDGVTGPGFRGGDIAGPGGHSLIQNLPVDSLGLSSVSIYLSTKPEVDGDQLRVKLRAVETGRIFAEWTPGTPEGRLGWVELALRHAIDEPALSLEVVVEWPSAQRGWAVALGAPHPYRDFCARTETGESLGSPIAMRLCTSLPGVRVAATANAVRPVDALHTFAEFVPYEAYAGVVQVVPALRDNKSTLVFYDRDIGCLTVHPRVGGLAVARMDVVVPKNAWSVSAQINLAHERASATSFGLMVCAATDEGRELARLSQLDGPSLSFSGWKTLSSLDTRSITAVLAAPAAKQLSLYLITRQAPDLSLDFAWARFSKFQFYVLPNSFVGENEPVAVALPAAALVHAGAE